MENLESVTVSFSTRLRQQYRVYTEMVVFSPRRTKPGEGFLNNVRLWGRKDNYSAMKFPENVYRQGRPFFFSAEYAAAQDRASQSRSDFYLDLSPNGRWFELELEVELFLVFSFLARVGHTYHHL